MQGVLFVSDDNVFPGARRSQDGLMQSHLRRRCRHRGGPSS